MRLSHQYCSSFHFLLPRNRDTTSSAHIEEKQHESLDGGVIPNQPEEGFLGELGMINSASKPQEMLPATQ